MVFQDNFFHFSHRGSLFCSILVEVRYLHSFIHGSPLIQSVISSLCHSFILAKLPNSNCKADHLSPGGNNLSSVFLWIFLFCLWDSKSSTFCIFILFYGFLFQSTEYIFAKIIHWQSPYSNISSGLLQCPCSFQLSWRENTKEESWESGD